MCFKLQFTQLYMINFLEIKIIKTLCFNPDYIRYKQKSPKMLNICKRNTLALIKLPSRNAVNTETSF